MGISNKRIFEPTYQKSSQWIFVDTFSKNDHLRSGHGSSTSSWTNQISIDSVVQSWPSFGKENMHISIKSINKKRYLQNNWGIARYRWFNSQLFLQGDEQTIGGTWVLQRILSHPTAPHGGEMDQNVIVQFLEWHKMTQKYAKIIQICGSCCYCPIPPIPPYQSTGLWLAFRIASFASDDSAKTPASDTDKVMPHQLQLVFPPER